MKFIICINWRDANGGIREHHPDGNYDGRIPLSGCLDKWDARRVAADYAAAGFWLSETRFIAPASILSVNLEEAKPR